MTEYFFHNMLELFLAHMSAPLFDQVLDKIVAFITGNLLNNAKP